jgi:integrase
MPIRKDPTSGIWKLDLRAPSGERIRRSTGTTDRKNAQEYHDRLKAELWRQEKLGEQPTRVFVFEEAANRFLDECEGQRDYATKLRHIEYWLSKFKGRGIRSLTSNDISDNIPTQSAHKDKGPTQLTGSTRNRYVSTIKRLLNLCEEWEWLDKAPKMPRFYEPEVRIRWEPPEVITELIKALQLEWMKDAAIVAVSTGMRGGELFSLKPQQIDLAQRNAWITHEKAKSKRARAIPLNEDSLEVLTRCLKTAKALVFTRGEGLETLIQEIDRCDFQRACRIAGVKDFHWHDLRHTWASWHVQRSTPLLVLKELGGWETIDMVQKYAHLAPSHIASHANTVKFWSQQIQKQETQSHPIALSA